MFQIGDALQNFPATVWSALRVVLESRPRVSTSASADAYAGLSTAGCAAGRNWLPLVSTNGATEPQPGTSGRRASAGSAGSRRAACRRERRGRGGGAVGGAQREQLRRGGLADRDAVLLGLAVGNGRELGAQQVVDACPRARVEGGEDVVRGLVGGRVGTGAAGAGTAALYGGVALVIETTASYSAACSMAKLRVGWMVAGWASGVPRIVISWRFQSMTDCPDPGASATPGWGGPAVARAGTATPRATAAAARVTSADVRTRMVPS